MTPFEAALSYKEIISLRSLSLLSEFESTAALKTLILDLRFDNTDLFLSLLFIFCLTLFFAYALLFAIIKA